MNIKEIIWWIVAVFLIMAAYQLATNYEKTYQSNDVSIPTKNVSATHIETEKTCKIQYSQWSRCNWDNTQTRFVTSIGPSACTGGQSLTDAVTTRSCEYVDEPVSQTLKRAIYDGSDYGMATIALSIVQDLINNHEGQFEHSYITENTLYPYESVFSNQLIHTYRLTSSTDGLVINYNLRSSNHTQPDIFDVTIFDSNADGIGDDIRINQDSFNNLDMHNEKIRGTWLSIINQYVLMYL